MLAVIFSSFNFHMSLESSVLLTYFLWRKSLVRFLKQYLNEVSAIPKYFLSGLLGADNTALYTMFAVKHLLSSGHSALFLQLHPYLSEVGWIILHCGEQWLSPYFYSNYNFIEFVLKIFDILWCFGKWRLINLKNFLPIFVFTIFENGGLNHIILRWLFLDLFMLIFVSVVLIVY